MTATRSFTSVAAAAAVVLFGLSWAALHGAWYDDAEIVDTPVYQGYGDAVEDGAVPYRDIRPEYPPGALLAFVVPSLVSEGEEGYRDAFEWLMLLCGVALVVGAAVALRGLGASRIRTVAALALVGGFPLLLGSVVLTRFDLLPAALVAAALAALLHGRDRLGFGLIGAGIVVKLYPGVLLPLALAWVWRRRGRREALVCLGVAAAVVVLVFLPFLLVAPDGVARSIGRQLSRPLQIESLGSALYLAAHHLLGLDVEMRSGHGSQNLHANGTGFAAVLFSLLQIGVLVWIWLRRPGTGEDLVRWSAAALVAFVALGKVLSPQFLVWLAPAVALVGVAAPPVLLAAALLLTQAWFPSRYWDLARDLDGLASALVVARDIVLVLLLLSLITARGRAPARSP